MSKYAEIREVKNVRLAPISRRSARGGIRRTIATSETVAVSMARIMVIVDQLPPRTGKDGHPDEQPATIV
jgi:hypothetical protein